MRSGGTPSRDNQSFWTGSIPWFSGKDLKSFVLRDSIEHVSPGAVKKGGIVGAGTLLVLVRGMTLMKEVPVGITTRNAAFNQDVKALVPDPNQADARFLGYYLRAENCRLRNCVTTAGHGTGRLPLESLEEYPVPLPSLSEQRKIADILGTWDDALEKLDALIAAKARRKQALMQQLLAVAAQKIGQGHARYRLGEVIERVTRKNTEGNENVLTISAQDGLINQREYFNRSVAGANLSGYFLLRRGEFAYNRSSSIGFPYGAIKRLDRYDAGVVSTLYLCFRLRDRAQVSSDYLAHYLDGGFLNSGLRSVAKEGARAHGLLNVTADEFLDIDIFLPPLPLQTKIAAILDAAATELCLLRDQRATVDQQKRGLMQQLLTGKVRTTPVSS